MFHTIRFFREDCSHIYSHSTVTFIHYLESLVFMLGPVLESSSYDELRISTSCKQTSARVYA